MNIDELEAGRELDALVAERVMDEPMPRLLEHAPGHIMDVVYSTGKNWYCLLDFNDGDVCNWIPCPFSEHNTLMYRVLETFDTFTIRKESDGQIYVFVVRGNVWAEDTSATIALAVCRAALKAVTTAAVLRQRAAAAGAEGGSGA